MKKFEVATISKDEYIQEVRHIIFDELGDHIRTDMDGEASKLLDDSCDMEEYNEARSNGNIIRLDKVLTVWLNGICFAWNYIHENNDEIEGICKDDVIPDFERIFDESRMIGINGNRVFYGEHPRI